MLWVKIVIVVSKLIKSILLSNYHNSPCHKLPYLRNMELEDIKKQKKIQVESENKELQ